MAYNFLRCDRDQPYLLPADVGDWLPEGHLAWFISDVALKPSPGAWPALPIRVASHRR